jgi:hypothetical protein
LDCSKRRIAFKPQDLTHRVLNGVISSMEVEPGSGER